ncbi:EAL domain-containing protein [Moritella sp.]|uniref:bifunctional diguanylate cyclase/phosphodiesterase n=1 Tax=Moritella sp. TaxID=78556 RepID=UPI0025F4FFB3|nr:EAL domain-containing protein [Moritella sp.]MCJ8348767.1 EAL domain-containing protein [Moritella sp.]
MKIMNQESYSDIEIPADILENWQGLIEHIAEITSIPISLVMRLQSHEIEVCVTNTHIDNPYQVGDREALNGELLCEAVIDSQQELLVPNMLRDLHWCNNPDVKLGVIAYCGLPLNWPTGKPFGTLCMLDIKDNSYTLPQRELLQLFKKMVEASLTILYQQYVLEQKVKQRTAELERVNHKLSKTLDLHAAAEQTIQLQKYRNILTGLPNINQLEKHFNDHILTSANKTALLHLRITNLTHIRNNLGLLCSQYITQYVADKLRLLYSKGVYVALLSDDCFALLYRQDNNDFMPTIMVIIDDILELLDMKVAFQEHRISLTYCVGASVYPDNSRSFLELMNNTSVSTSQCQLNNKSYQFFDAVMKTDLMDRFQIESQLYNALENDELSLHYQPFFDVANNQLIGSEALLRWHNPLLGYVAPDKFIAIAEQSGMMVEIGYFVLRSAIQQLARWQQVHNEAFFIAVNLSPLQLQDKELVNKIQDLLETYNVSANSLEIEITENVFLGDQDGALQILQDIDALGIRIALDDFGTGYSSLSYIQRFPFSSVKIDRSFIASLATSELNQHLVKAIISMATAFNLKVVAEGIEDATQASFIKNAGGHIYQGYFFGRPVGADEFTRLYVNPLSLLVN